MPLPVLQHRVQNEGRLTAIEKIKNWLESARFTDARIDALDELIARARSRMEGSRSGGGGGGGGIKRDFSDALARIEGYEEEKRRIMSTYAAVKTAIYGVSDIRWRTALELYYLRDYKWAEVAHALGYDEKTIGRWHTCAVEEIKKKTGA